MTDKLVTAVKNVQNGDREAFRELFEEFCKTVYFQVSNIIDNKHDVDDIVSDVFATAFEKIGDLKTAEAFPSWLSKIAVNKSTDYLRASRKLFEFEIVEAIGIDDFEEIDSKMIPEKALDNAETAQLIYEIIGQLPLPQRVCIHFYYYEAMKVSEIAEKLAVSESTVKTRLSLARAKIREQLEQRGEKDGLRLWMASPLMLVPVLKLAMQSTQVPAGISQVVMSALGIGAEAAGAAAGAGVAAAGGAAGTGGAAVSGATTGAATATGTAVSTKVVAASIAAATIAAGVITTAVLLGGEDGEISGAMPIELKAIVIDYSDNDITDDQLFDIVEVIREIETTGIIPDDVNFYLKWDYNREYGETYEYFEELYGSIEKNRFRFIMYGDRNHIYFTEYISIYLDSFLRERKDEMASEYFDELFYYYEGILTEVNSTRTVPEGVHIGLDISRTNISDITMLAQLESLTSLNLARCQIADISPLADMQKLTSLNLGFNNQITDISPLSNLTGLTSLNIVAVSAVDISLLSNMVNLSELCISGAENISYLSELKNLNELYIFNNRDINNAEPLTELIHLTKLRTLFLSSPGFPINDISPLSELTNLRVLYLDDFNSSDGMLNDISPLAELSKLTFLYLYLNSDTFNDLTPLAGLNNLTYLQIAPSMADDITPLAGLSKLTELGIHGIFSDISPLANLTNLSSLGMSGDKINDYSALNELVNLETLTLNINELNTVSVDPTPPNLTRFSIRIQRENQIDDISPLAEFTNLTSLDFCINRIETNDFSPLARLTNLEELSLYNDYYYYPYDNIDPSDRVYNRINDISWISSLTNLTYLNLENNNISDISALIGLTNLTYLNLENNNIRDISALIGLTNLTDLRLYNNNISDEDLDILRDALPNFNIR